MGAVDTPLRFHASTTRWDCTDSALRTHADSVRKACNASFDGCVTSTSNWCSP